MNNLLAYVTQLMAEQEFHLRRVLAPGLCVLLAFFCGCKTVSVTSSNQISPEAALEQFYNNKGAEDTLMDPLIIAGEKVVPLVLKEVKNKAMPRRRYAIGFLGNGSYREALPALETILQDVGEKDYFRADALISIYQIDESLGGELAQKYKGEKNTLGDISRRVLAGDAELKKKRSYSDAVAGKHE